MIIDGKAIAGQRLEVLRNKIQETKIKPKLAVVMKPGDKATEIYVGQKKRRAAEVGIDVEIVDSIEKVSSDADGIIVQLPYPNQEEVITKIPLSKDVDNLTGKSKFVAPAVAAVLQVVGDLTGKTVAVVGQGVLVGKPVADYLEKQGVKVVRCDEYTNSLSLRNQSKKADVLVVATGVPNLIKADMIKPGAIVIDFGSPKPEVDPKVSEMATLTPVPGGVGPLTVAALLENVVGAAAYNAKH